MAGSFAGQVAGNILGVQDGYSLKSMLASGLTAGATAGLGSVLGVGSSTGGLTASQKAQLAAGGSIAGTMSNKLVGNHASFSWRAVATSAVTASVMHHLGISNQNSPFESFNEGQNIISGTLNGIAGAAIGYGAGKLIQQGNDRPSWNFNNAATDAFGNALGNSFVANRVKAEQTRLKAMRASEAMSDQASKAVNAKLDAQLANTSNTAMANVTAESQAQTDRMIQALAYNRALDFNELEAAQSAKRTDQTRARIEASLEYSKLLEHDAASKYYDVARSGVMVAEYERQHKYYAWRDKGGNGQGLGDGYTTFTLTSLLESQYSREFGTEATNWAPYGQFRQKVSAHLEGFNIGKVENANGKTYAHVFGSHAANNTLGLPENFRRSNLNNYALNKAVLGAGSFQDLTRAQTYIEAFDPRTAGGKLGALGLGIDAGLEYADYKLGHGDGYKLAAGLTNVAIEGVAVTAGTVFAGAVMASLGLASLPILATGAILFGVGVALGYGYDIAAEKFEVKNNLSDLYRKIGD